MPYLDHAATAPLRDEAREAWVAASRVVGNASSIHGGGQAARRLLEESRERIAAVLGCDSVEVVLTASGTESVNLGVKGLWWARAAGDAVVLPDGEHHATIEAVGWLAEREAARVRRVPIDGVGRIAPAAFGAALEGEDGDRAALATALVAGNETGTVNDAAALSQVAADAGVPLHLDAVAALGHVPVRFRQWRADAAPGAGLAALSVSAHKVGGPVGVGALVVARTASPQALLHGGGQQRGLRSGTQDVAGAAAFAVAAELAEAERDAESARLRVLGERLLRGIRAVVPGAQLLGDPVDRVPGNVHVLFPDAEGETLLFLFDQQSVAVSTGSACQAGVAKPSHVVLALGRSEREARSVLRFTLGRTTTDADVDAVLAALPSVHALAAGARARAGS